MKTESKLFRIYSTIEVIIKKEFKVLATLALFLSFIGALDLFLSKESNFFVLFLLTALAIITMLALFSILLDIAKGISSPKDSIVKILNYKTIFRFIVVGLISSMAVGIISISGTLVFLSMFAADSGPNIVATIMFFAGIALFIISLPFLARVLPCLLFSLFYTIERKDITIKESIKAGWKLSKVNFWQTISIFCVMVVMNYLFKAHLKSLLGNFAIIISGLLLVLEILLFAILYKMASDDYASI